MHGRILAAAADLFIERGYDGTSIEAIASHAGVGKLTVYRRFPDKAALFQAVMQRLFDQWTSAAADIGDSDGSLADVLTSVGRKTLSIALSPLSIALTGSWRN